MDPHETKTKIRYVRTGSKGATSKEHKIAVVIEQSKESDVFVTWDVNKDNEVNTFEHGHDPQIFWDQDGHPYAMENDCVYFSDTGVRLKCYDLRQATTNDDL